jgi:hypothetical protein
MEQTRPEAIIGDSEMANELWFYWGYNTPLNSGESEFSPYEGKKHSPTWEHVEFYIHGFRKYSGGATLSLLKPIRKDADGDTWYETIKALELLVDKGSFILNFSENKDNEPDVISYWNPNADPTKVEILGNCWNGRMICKDFDIAIKYFKEFFETGDITKDHFL